MSRNSTPHIPRVALLVRGTDSIVAVTKRNAEEQAIQTYFEQQGIEDPTPAQMSEARRSLGFQLQPR